jgi:hypothetical protein
MSEATPQQDGQFPFYRPQAGNSDFNALCFLVQTMLEQVNVATLVTVKAVHTHGRTGAAGTVDVVPLTSLVDGTGAAWPHTTVYGLPFFRLQGGGGAVICDPRVGDIGIALFCDRDISSVKRTSKAATPNSARRFSMSDGIYLGGWMSQQEPSTAVILDEDGCEITANTLVDGYVNNTSGYRVNGTQVVGAQQSHIAAIAPGGTTDTNCRTTVTAILALLQNHGLMS